MNCVISAGNLKVFGRAIQSLAKIPGEELFIEAKDDGLFLRTLNSSRSAYGCFSFKPQFFVSFITVAEKPRADTASTSAGDGDFTSENRCKIPMKSALIMFKSLSNLEKSIELCKIWINVEKCRLFFQLLCKYGVTRTSSFLLIDCEPIETLYDKGKCKFKIVAPGPVLVDGVMNNFKSGQEDVTLSVTIGDLMLKNCLDDAPDPDKCLKTQLRYDVAEFDQFVVKEPSEVTFCLKELRALLSFVEAFHLSVSVNFDGAGKPIIFGLEDPNFTAELVLASYIIQDFSQTIMPATTDSPLVGVDSQSLRQNSEPLYPNLVIKSSTNGNAARETLSTKNSVNRRVSGEEEETADMDTERLETDDVMPQSPKAKKAKSFLFTGWSQRTTASSMSSQSTMLNDDHTVLAPDSDLDDY